MFIFVAYAISLGRWFHKSTTLFVKKFFRNDNLAYYFLNLNWFPLVMCIVVFINGQSVMYTP